MGTGLRELKRNFKELRDISERQETRVRYHETKLHNIAIAYLVWQRLFFFAISQTSSSFKCNDWWVVLASSLLCSFIYFCLCLNAATMLYRTQYQLDIICEELTEICEKMLVARHEDDVGLSLEAGEFSHEFEFIVHERMLMFDPFGIAGRKVYIYFTVCALIAVTAIELYACRHLLCH